MKIEFDPAKDAANNAKHGVSLRMAVWLDWETALIWKDERFDYGETRMNALGLVGRRVYFAAFTDRAMGRRVISFPKANDREVRRYADASS